MRDLSGGQDLKSLVTITSRDRQCRDAIAKGYHSLETAAVTVLMARYRAPFFITTSDHSLDLPVLYRNEKYVLYGAES